MGQLSPAPTTNTLSRGNGDRQYNNNKGDLFDIHLPHKWEPRALHTHTHTYELGVGGGGGVDTAVLKRQFSNSYEQVSLEGDFEKGRKIRVADCLRQTVSNRWASL